MVFSGTRELGVATSMRKIFAIFGMGLILGGCNQTSPYKGPLANSFQKNNVGKSYSYQVVDGFSRDTAETKLERFEVRAGDCNSRQHVTYKVTRSDCLRGATRSENTFYNARLKQSEHWYGFELYLPTDYVIDYPRQTPIFFQIQQYSKDSQSGPWISISERDGILRANGAEVAKGETLRGKWHSFKIHARWSEDKDGFVRIYYQDRLIAERAKTKTILYDNVRVKYGIYRMPSGEIYDPSYVPPNHTVFFKNIRAAKSKEELENR